MKLNHAQWTVLQYIINFRLFRAYKQPTAETKGGSFLIIRAASIGAI